MFAGIAAFNAIVVAVAFGVFKKFESLERAELSAYLTLVAWGSFLYGLIISKP